MGPFLCLGQACLTADFSEQFVLIGKSKPFIFKAQGDAGEFDINRF